MSKLSRGRKFCQTSYSVIWTFPILQQHIIALLVIYIKMRRTGEAYTDRQSSHSRLDRAEPYGRSPLRRGGLSRPFGLRSTNAIAGRAVVAFFATAQSVQKSTQKSVQKLSATFFSYFTLFQKSFSPFISKYIWSGPFKWHTRESPLDGLTTTWSPRTSYSTRSVAPHRYILDDLNSMDPQPISCNSPSLEAASHLPSTGFFWHAQSTSASDIKNTNGILFIPTPQYRQFLPNFAKMQLFSCENCLQKNRRF